MWMDTSDAQNYVLNLLSPGAPVKAKRHREDSEDITFKSPSETSPPKKMSNLDSKVVSDSLKEYMEELRNDFKQEFKLLREEYKRDFKTLQTNVAELKESMWTKSELKSAENMLLLEVSGAKATVDDVSDKVNTIKKEYDERITQLEAELMAITANGITGNTDFPVETTCIISGLWHESGEDLKSRCTEIIKNGLGLYDVDKVSTKRVGMYDGKPGITKMQL